MITNEMEYVEPIAYDLTNKQMIQKIAGEPIENIKPSLKLKNLQEEYANIRTENSPPRNKPFLMNRLNLEDA